MTDIAIESGWTESRIEDLKRLLPQGFSASQIASQLGGVTRNAVIGKVARLGLHLTTPARTPKVKDPLMQSEPQPRQPRARTTPFNFQSPSGSVMPRDVKPKASGLDPNEVPHVQRLQLHQLSHRTCRWPYGDVGAPDFFFCGAEKDIVAGPYCPMHQRVSRGQG